MVVTHKFKKNLTPLDKKVGIALFRLVNKRISRNLPLPSGKQMKNIERRIRKQDRNRKLMQRKRKEKYRHR